MDTASIIDRYANILETLNAKTAKLQSQLPDIPCKNRCFTCCEQLFPITFLEAFYISRWIHTGMDADEKAERTQYAQVINEKIASALPFDYLNQHRLSEKEALNIHALFNKGLHMIQTACPALNTKRAKGSCTVYESRPHECRVQGFSVNFFPESLLLETSGMQSTEVPYNKEVGGQIAGCFRFENLQHLAPKLMDYNYLYPEKLELDCALIAELTQNYFPQKIMYYTTMCMPFLKNFEDEDWTMFFKKRIPELTEKNTCSVVVDV